MKEFVGFYCNGKYQVGCNGATIYVYDMNDVELARFKDINYVYRGAFKPNTNIFVAKSTADKLAIYDLDSLKLMKKITIAADGSNDQGFAFSCSGDLFYNIEKPESSLITQLAVYDGSDFTKIATYFTDDKVFLNHIEVYPDEIYLLGYVKSNDVTRSYCFVSKYADGNIVEPREIKSEDYTFFKREITDYDYLILYKDWEISGFTKKQGNMFGSNRRERPRVTIKQVYEANA